MIKDFHINLEKQTALATIMVNGRDTKVFCDKPDYGGKLFREVLLTYIGDGVGALYFDGTGIVSAGEKPSEHHEFDYALKQWVDPRTLQDFKDAKWAEIKQHREAAENGGFTWDGSPFDSTPISQSRIQGAAQLATLAKINNQPFSIEWTLMNNGTRSLSADDMIAVGMALGAHINEQHVRARQLREQIEAATTPEQVQAVRWVY